MNILSELFLKVLQSRKHGLKLCIFFLLQKKKKQTKAFQGLAVLKLSLQQVFCSDQCNLFFFLFLFTGVSRQVELYKLVSKADCGKEKKGI